MGLAQVPPRHLRRILEDRVHVRRRDHLLRWLCRRLVRGSPEGPVLVRRGGVRSYGDDPRTGELTRAEPTAEEYSAFFDAIMAMP